MYVWLKEGFSRMKFDYVFEPFLLLLIFTYFSVNFSRNHLFLERFQWWLCPLRTSWPESIGKIFDQIKTLFWISIVYLARLVSLIYCFGRLYSHIVTCLLIVLAYVVPLIFIILRFFCDFLQKTCIFRARKPFVNPSHFWLI